MSGPIVTVTHTDSNLLEDEDLWPRILLSVHFLTSPQSVPNVSKNEKNNTKNFWETVSS